MKLRSSLLFLVAYLLPLTPQAQDLNNKIFMTVNGTGIQSGEFIRMYNKSSEPDKPLDIDSYLQQFIVFKLKVADAVNEGYDTTRAFRNELNGYRKQLAQSYLTDNQAKEALLKKTYQKYLSEINAWHILIAMTQDPKPEDTLRAWEKASGIRERMINGEAFEQVARGTSDDQSVKVNGGNLGYFTVFQMIMPFEDAAYSLRKGEISYPVRTPYGYHIIKVTDKRPSRGRVHVAHIMKSAPPGSKDDAILKASKDIDSIYRKLEVGASFSVLAKALSDHKESAARGGELNWFGAGEMIPEFAEAAFRLTDTGSYTNPVRTLYGWHIIKLLEKKPPGSFEESRSWLESKINQSYLNSLIKKQFVSKLKKEYKFNINEDAYKWFVRNTDSLIIQGLKKYYRDSIPAGNLYSFANLYLTTREFANFVERRRSTVVTMDSVQFIDRSIETRSSDHIIDYENSILEKKYPEFRYLMNEFHDGILLFEISGKKVWNRISSDSLELMKYYVDHKTDHLSGKGIEARIYTLKSADREKDLESAYRKYSGKPDIDERLIKKFIIKGTSQLVIRDSTWYYGYDKEIDNQPWETGTHTFTWKGFPSILVMNRIIDPVPLPFEDVQAEMLSGYQEQLESDWIGQLKHKYAVKIDSTEFNNVKKKIADE